MRNNFLIGPNFLVNKNFVGFNPLNIQIPNPFVGQDQEKNKVTVDHFDVSMDVLLSGSSEHLFSMDWFSEYHRLFSVQLNVLGVVNGLKKEP